nr:AsmA-like C-terminal region-containing protein [uncultured Celeribacter sp.]
MTERPDPDPEQTPKERPETLPEESPVATAEPSPAKPLRARRPRAHRIGIWSLVVMALISLLLGVAFLAFTGRQITFPDALTDRIEATINHDLNGPKVSIGQIVAVVDRNFVPRVTARNVGLIDGSGAEIARLNTLRAVLSKEALMARQLRPDTLRLSGAQIVVRRRADGTMALDFGGARGAVGSAAEVLEAVDRAFSTDPLSDIRQVEARDVTVSLEDARSGRVWQATDAGVTLRNSDASLNLALSFELFNGTEDLSDIEMSFSLDKSSLATVMALDITQAPTQDFALQSPALSFLSVVHAPLSASMRVEIDGTGKLSRYTGTMEIGAGQIVAAEGAPPLEFQGGKGYFDYDPREERIEFPQFNLSTDALSLRGAGHILLSDFVNTWPQTFTGQWQFSDIRIASEGLFDQPVGFDRGMADIKMTLNPFRLDIGGLDLAQGDTWLRGSARAQATSDGWTVGADLAADSLSGAALLALWPPAAAAKTRTWIAQNMYEVTYHDLNAAIRVRPDQPKPSFAVDWSFDDLNMRFMKTQPPVTGGRGYGAIFGNAMTVTLEGGMIAAPSGGDIDVAGTVLRIPDITQKPARMEIGLRTQSRIEAAMALMAAPPFSILKNAPYGPDVAEGDAQLRGRIELPLIKKVMPTDVNYLLQGRLQEVHSEQLMRGQVLAADDLAVTVDPAGLTIAGDVRIGQAKAAGQWHKAFGPEHKGVSQVTGTVTLDQAFLDTFKIGLPAGMVQGATTGEMTVDLRRGEVPRFAMSSNLSGLRLTVPGLGWGKPAGTQGRLEVAGTAGPVPRVSSLTLSGAGLEARGGQVLLTDAKTLDRLSFERVTIGNWLDVPVTVIGQGAGQPVRIDISGGSLNLARASFGGGGSSGAAAAIPVQVALDHLYLSEGLDLRNASAKLSVGRGVTGSFEGLLNGRGPLTGTIAPGAHGVTIAASSQNAGAVVAAMGVLQEASGGTLGLRLTALPEKGSYDGSVLIENIRVQSAPTLAELLSAVSVVGLIEQMTGEGGLLFSTVKADFHLRPGRLTIRDGSAEGPSLGISVEGLYDTVAKTVDLQGVVSPIYFLNALGQVVARQGEGLFGFTYTLKGAAKSPAVGVNPLSLLAPGALRDLFRSKPAGDD